MATDVVTQASEDAGPLVERLHSEAFERRERRAEIDEEYKHFWEERKTKAEALVQSGRAGWRAMEGWQRVRSQEDWEDILAVAGSDLYRGRFFLEVLGAERYLEPERMALLLTLREAWIEEYGISTAPELMLMDSALIALHNQLRTQQLIGNLFSSIEAEFFGRDDPMPKLREKHGYTIQGWRVDDLAQRLTEELQPLLDRANRMLIRNLKALRDLRNAGITVNVNEPSQVNLAQQQINALGTPADEE